MYQIGSNLGQIGAQVGQIGAWVKTWVSSGSQVDNSDFFYFSFLIHFKLN